MAIFPISMNENRAMFWSLAVRQIPSSPKSSAMYSHASVRSSSGQAQYSTFVYMHAVRHIILDGVHADPHELSISPTASHQLTSLGVHQQCEHAIIRQPNNPTNIETRSNASTSLCGTRIDVISERAKNTEIMMACAPHNPRPKIETRNSGETRPGRGYI